MSPRWYIPPGIPMPTHLPPLPRLHVLPEHGPGGCDDGERGGVVVSADGWVPARAGCFRKTRAGWWVDLGGTAPQGLARLSVTAGTAIPMGGGHLLVPHLLRVDPDAGLVYAGTTEFRDYAWQPPQAIAELLWKIKAVVQWQDGHDPLDDDAVTSLAVAVLAVNYHLSIHELAITGWLTSDLVTRILVIASGLEQAQTPQPVLDGE